MNKIQQHMAMPHDGFIRPRYVCRNGFSVSIQANSGAYCSPREDGHGADYTQVELGFPSATPPQYIMEYMDGDGEPTDAVYGYVPVELVERMLCENDMMPIKASA